jgi:hypothetical protein
MRMRPVRQSALLHACRIGPPQRRTCMVAAPCAPNVSLSLQHHNGEAMLQQGPTSLQA